MSSSHARLALALTLLLGALVLSPAAAQAKPSILGGPRVDVATVPYVASLTLTNPAGDVFETCSGAIIDARRVLTSAHCFDSPGKVPAGGSVRVGSNVMVPMDPDPGAQDIPMQFPPRVHPRHTPDPALVQPDDIAVVTLSRDIAFGPRAQPVPLVAPNAYPATGAGLVQAGYGKQVAAADSGDGHLYGRLANVLSPDDCGASNAIQLCYSQPATAGCPGDSGGPIVVGGQLVGINASGECAAGSSGSAASIAAPEIRAFIDGSDAPPVAPVGSTFPSISGYAQVGRTLTCAPGGWSGAGAFNYVFEDARDGTQLQAGASPTRVAQAADVGRPIRCLVQAVGAGGIGQRHSGTLPAIVPAPPPTSTSTSTTTTTTAPALSGASISVSVASRVRRGSRASLRVRVRTGDTALGRNQICVTVSRRARLVRSRGALHARTSSCRSYSRQSANTTRTIALRVRAGSRGSVRISARVTPEGSAPLTAARTVRAR